MCICFVIALDLFLASERTKRWNSFVVNDFDRFMTSEGSKKFILAFTLKSEQSVAHRGHKIFYLEFSVLQRIYLSIL